MEPQIFAVNNGKKAGWGKQKFLEKGKGEVEGPLREL